MLLVKEKVTKRNIYHYSFCDTYVELELKKSYLTLMKNHYLKEKISKHFKNTIKILTEQRKQISRIKFVVYRKIMILCNLTLLHYPYETPF